MDCGKEKPWNKKDKEVKRDNTTKTLPLKTSMDSSLPPIVQNPGLPMLSYLDTAINMDCGKEKPWNKKDMKDKEVKQGNTTKKLILKVSMNSPNTTRTKLENKVKKDALIKEIDDLDIQLKSSSAKIDNKLTPVGKSRPSIVNLVKPEAKINTSFLEKKVGDFKYATRLDSPLISNILLDSKIPLGSCNFMDEELPRNLCQDALDHLSRCHKEFYNLLNNYDLLDEVKEAVNENNTCFLFLVPSYNVLTKEGAPIPSEDLLRYHIAKVPGNTLNLIKYASLLEDQAITYLFAGGEYYFGGVRATPDKYYPRHIMHLNGIMDFNEIPGELSIDKNEDNLIEDFSDDDEQVEEDNNDPQPPVNKEDLEQTNNNNNNNTLPPVQESSDAVPPVEESSNVVPPSGYPPGYIPTGQYGTRSIPHTKMNAYCMSNCSEVENKALRTVIEKFNSDYFSAPVSMKDMYDKRKKAILSVDFTFRHYDTKPLYQTYQAGNMKDLIRLECASHYQVSVPKTQYYTVKIGGKFMTVYPVSVDKKISLDRMLSGLVEFQMTSPYNNTRKMIVLTKFHPSVFQKNTYLSENEQIMLRFQDSYLTAILCRDKHQMITVPVRAVGTKHFLELCFSQSQKDLAYSQSMDQHDFDALAMNNSKIERFFNRAGRVMTAPLKKRNSKMLEPILTSDRNKLSLPVMSPDVKSMSMTVEFYADDMELLHTQTYDGTGAMFGVNMLSYVLFTSNGPLLTYIKKSSYARFTLHGRVNYLVNLKKIKSENTFWNAGTTSSYYMIENAFFKLVFDIKKVSDVNDEFTIYRVDRAAL